MILELAMLFWDGERALKLALEFSLRNPCLETRPDVPTRRHNLPLVTGQQWHEAQVHVIRIAYLKNVPESDYDIKYDDDPDEDVTPVVESISPMRHEDAHILQQDGNFDEDDCRVIHNGLDH